MDTLEKIIINLEDASDDESTDDVAGADSDCDYDETLATALRQENEQESLKLSEIMQHNMYSF